MYKWLQYDEVIQLIIDVLSSESSSGIYGIHGIIKGNAIQWVAACDCVFTNTFISNINNLNH